MPAPRSADQGSTDIVLLCRDSPSARIVYAALAHSFRFVEPIVEQPLSRWELARRRARKLGWRTVAGQVAFVTLGVPLLARAAAARINEIRDVWNLHEVPLPADAIHVGSVNDDQTRTLLRQLSPRVVVVSGTRIIGEATLEAVEAHFINIHFGVTPLYRGVHGAYWALVEGRPDLVGTTIHVVDRGIDTGGIIAQRRFAVTSSDTFATYPYLHLAAGLPALRGAVDAAMSGTLAVQEPDASLGSKLRYHPTLGQYLKVRMTRGIK